MSSRWIDILTAFEPSYRELESRMKLGPNIRCTLQKKGSKTLLQLTEIWSNDDHVYYVTERSDRFDDYVAWTEEQLRTWKSVRRTAWDQWLFTRQKDAEKFVILFNLKWA